MFLRFVAGNKIKRKNEYHGIITQAKIMIEQEILEIIDVIKVEDIFQVLNNNLPCPPFSKKSRPNNAISWFKESAEEYIKLMYQLKIIIEKYGCETLVLKTEDAGKKIYEDDFQIVATNKKY